MILSYRAWQAYFRADSTIVGRPVTLDRTTYTVVGVMPQGFELPGIFDSQSAFWAPLVQSIESRRRLLGLPVIARVKDGVTASRRDRGRHDRARDSRRSAPGPTHTGLRPSEG